MRKALRVIEQNIDRIGDSAPDLAWRLECFYVARTSKDDSLVKRCIARLIELQRQDGAWTSGNGKKYIVSTTINVLKALRTYKIW